jgi:uncharacterized protein YukE
MSNDLIAAREDQTEWYTGLGIAESIADISSGVESENWVEAGIGIVATAGEAAAWATDPFGQLIQYGVSWLMEHLQPLRDALDWLAGDPPQIEAYAQTWRNVSTAVAATATTLRDRSQADTTSWQGAAANTYRSHATALAQAITDTAKTAELISLVVSVAGMLVASVRELVRDMIAELVAILIERAWLWAAETATVVGAPAAEAQIQALVAKWVGKVARVIAKLIRSLNNLDGLTKKLDELWELIRQALRRLGKEDVEEPNPEAKNPIAAPNQKSPTTKSSPDGTTSSAESPSGPTSSTPTTPEGTTTKPSGTGSPSGDASRAPTQPSGTASPSGDGAPTASGTGSGNKPAARRRRPTGPARPERARARRPEDPPTGAPAPSPRPNTSEQPHQGAQHGDSAQPPRSDRRGHRRHPSWSGTLEPQHLTIRDQRSGLRRRRERHRVPRVRARVRSTRPKRVRNAEEDHRARRGRRRGTTGRAPQPAVRQRRGMGARGPTLP